MEKKTLKETIIDPYIVLGIPYDADDDQINQAFQKAMCISNGSSEVVNAYNLIRTQKERFGYQWGHVCSFIFPPDCAEPQNLDLDLEALIREVAFQSEWELGDDQCPMKV